MGKFKNCFRSQGGAVIETTCQASKDNSTSSGRDVIALHTKKKTSRAKRKPATNISQHRYYFYD